MAVDDDILRRADEIRKARETPPEWFGELAKVLEALRAVSKQSYTKEAVYVRFCGDSSGSVRYAATDTRMHHFHSLADFWRFIQPYMKP